MFCIVGVGAEATCRALSTDAGLVVLSVCCDMAGLHDGTVVLEWAADHAAELGADPGRLLVAGEGAGAAVAAAVALEAREQGWPAVSRQVLINTPPVSWTAEPGVAPATVVTVAGHPRGDGGRYAGQLREAGVAVDELRCAVAELATGKMLTDLGAAVRRVLSDESGPPPTSSCSVKPVG